jgi:DNA-binding CsgD family transcriptional regulator/tetratricopeptide (TPR) repeat protein
MALELLERDTGLHQLEAALGEALAGEGRVALVGGEAGIGKTSLVERFTGEQRLSVRVWWGACDALFTPRPLGPLHDMAAQAESNLAALLASDDNPTTLFAACLAELQSKPTVAVFEDVHWADEATFDLLRFLARRIARAQVLLVLTYRDDELGPRHPLRALLGNLARLPAVRRIALAPFSEGAVRELVGQRAIDALALHRQTGGNPFFVTEILANLGHNLPSTVRDAVLARAVRLSASAQAVLQAAAVIGPRIEAWLLAEVTGAEASAVDECLAVGVLVAQGEAVAFRHELARETILESTSPTHRLALHHMTLDSLKASPATRNDLARLAHHAEAAGDREAVLEYAPAAARQAATAGAHREAATLYGLALRYAADLAPTDRARMLENYSDACNVSDRLAESVAAQRQAVEIWGKLGNPLEEGAALGTLTIVLRNNGNNVEAEVACRRAIELLEPLPPGPELALAYRMWAILRLARRDVPEALAWGQKAVELAEQVGAPNVAAMAHVAIGSAWLFLDYERGEAYLQDRLNVARQSGTESEIANLLAYVASCTGELYHFEKAERYLAEGLAHTAERGLDVFYRYLLAWQAIIHLYRGRWSDGLEAAGEVLRSPTVAPITSIPALVAQGRLRARRGDPGAEETLADALELAQGSGNLPHLAMVHAALAEAAWLAGDPERTRREAAAVYDLAVERRHPWFTGELAYWRWRAGEAVVVPEWAAQPFTFQVAGDWCAAVAEWERLGCPYEQAGALAEGGNEAQVAAIDIYERLGARPALNELRRKMQAAGEPVPRGPRPATRENPFGLTAREMEILGLLAEGLSNAGIAARLHISPKTAGHHVSAVLAKLSVHTREAAAALARQHPHFQIK